MAAEREIFESLFGLKGDEQMVRSIRKFEMRKNTEYVSFGRWNVMFDFEGM